MQALASRAEEGFGEGTERIAGVMRVTTSEAFGVHVLPPWLAVLMREEPEPDHELGVTQRAENLLRRDADIAVRFARPEQDAVIANRVGQVRLGLFASADNLARHRPTAAGDEPVVEPRSRGRARRSRNDSRTTAPSACRWQKTGAPTCTAWRTMQVQRHSNLEASKPFGILQGAGSDAGRGCVGPVHVGARRRPGRRALGTGIARVRRSGSTPTSGECGVSPSAAPRSAP